MPAPFSHGAAGASAESTVRDQLAGERNVRDADSLVDATDNSEAQQQHPYCRLLAPHLHSYAALFADSRRLWSCDHHVTCVDKLRFALCLYILVQTTVGVWYVHFDSECLCPEVQKLVSRSLALSYFYLCNYVRFKAKYWWLYVCSCAYIVWGDRGRWDVAVHSPSGWPFGVSSKEEKQNITVKHDKIWDLLLHVFNAQFTHIDVFCWALSHIVFALDDWLLMLRHHVVLTDYDEGPHDTPFVCPLPCLDLWN